MNALCLAAMLGLSAPPPTEAEVARLAAETASSFEKLIRFWNGSNEAIALIKAGRVDMAAGRLPAAGEKFQKALDSMERLVGKDHTIVGICHGQMAAYYAESGDLSQAEEHARKHYKSSTDPLSPGLLMTEENQAWNRALARNALGTILREQGHLAEADEFLRLALKDWRVAHPEPEGHIHIVMTLANIAGVKIGLGQDDEARDYANQAWKMYKGLAERNGQMTEPQLVMRLLSAIGEILRVSGDSEAAYQIHGTSELALRTLYPGGHPDLAMALRNFAVIKRDSGERNEALPMLVEAEAMLRKFYPGGHVNIVKTIFDRAGVLADLGRTAESEEACRAGIAAADALYHPDRFPAYHPDAAAFCGFMGGMRLAKAETRTEAARWYREALWIADHHVSDQMGLLSEGEAFALSRAAPDYLNGLLTATAGETFDSRDYEHVWQTKAAVMRTLERRRDALLAAADPEAKALAVNLASVRSRLASQALQPSSRNLSAAVTALAAEKQDLERKLAAKLRRGTDDSARTTPDGLRAALPPTAVFVDFLRYVRHTTRPWATVPTADRAEFHYAAFVVENSRPVQRIELGPADAIESAVDRWIEIIVAERGSMRDERAAAAEVHRLVWAPLASRIVNKRTIYISPDSELTRLPFAALPGKLPGTVLLEESAVAVVPYGGFLQTRLTARRQDAAGTPSLLLVNSVDYGAPGKWPPLPGTQEEGRAIAAEAQARGCSVTHRTGLEASVERIRNDLAGVRFAHLATHGRFAKRLPRENRGSGDRNPLLLSGLVLCGANGPTPADGGVLLAEAVAGLRLENLEVAVLSACNTSLGRIAGGEGVFSLQRAFHLAGTRSVIASLWEINDIGTSTLMARYYQNLWSEPRRTPLEALRQAQLEIYRNPSLLPASARRGSDMTLVPLEPRPAAVVPGAPRSPTFYWAGFAFSGAFPE